MYGSTSQTSPPSGPESRLLVSPMDMTVHDCPVLDDPELDPRPRSTHRSLPLFVEEEEEDEEDKDEERKARRRMYEKKDKEKEERRESKSRRKGKN